MADDWREYQEAAADFFRSLGLEAETNVTLEGARTHHDIDVVVKSRHVGFEVLWLVECKHWKRKVSKLHVLGLRQIVVDLGADRGILLCETGFHSGAIEAANLTNVTLTSLAEFQSTACNQIMSMRIRDLYDRIETCKERYWGIPKSDRIEQGLRPDVGSSGYRGTLAIDLSFELLSKALRGDYPITCDSLVALVEGMPPQFDSAEEILTVVDPMVSELEARLDAFDNRAAKR